MFLSILEVRKDSKFWIRGYSTIEFYPAGLDLLKFGNLKYSLYDLRVTKSKLAKWKNNFQHNSTYIKWTILEIIDFTVDDQTVNVELSHVLYFWKLSDF
jgi:hypothetical protein